ncbi:mannitol dehydrogenase family protein [Primorskyibacter aestuariivivens]|uniref:mannitol dehydrogenase family protein n=1 Tax=Primorskyibacter aestuariivivens TaxID=1888912 RepID=UPI002300C612|nr:mannitol dehydrogenase family protein [Primorskyibacter aestuariivivens]MDA7428330.1 mannitol dehydrogenase family protein [Primorskyibacter aestuariivivens]
MKLSNETLSMLPENVKRPAYDRTALTPGIVHIGLGNFHRGHQAWYLHRLMQQGEALDWAIIGAGVRQYDAEMRGRLLAQDCLTTLIELDPAGTSTEVIGSMIDYLPIEEGNRPLIDRMSQSDIRIVGLTVTEGGYYLDPTSGAFDTAHTDIQHDVANPDRPKTVFGAIVAALKARRAAGFTPFTALSCDNLQGNGAILRSCVVGLARLTDPELADWIDGQGAFPNSMVDCIVPATGPDVIAKAEALGISDAAPVSHENFRQWVIEDDFCAGRPAWEKVGVTLTDDVHSYESMKIRILNGGHQVLANAGEILSVPTIAACMQDPDISAFFRKVQEEGILPYVSPVPGMTPAAYLDLIERRFSNPEIHDTTRRVAFDGSSRHPGFILPTLRDTLAAGGSVEALALIEALWARMCAGTREDSSTIAPNDPFWDALQNVALQARDTPSAWLAQRDTYGDLAKQADFAEAFNTWLVGLWRDGCRATLQRYLRS